MSGTPSEQPPALTQTHPPEPYDPHDTHIAVLSTHTQTHSTHQPHTARPHVAPCLAVFHQSSARLCSTYSRPTHHCRLQRSAGWDVSDTPSEPPPPPSTRPGRIAAPKKLGFSCFLLVYFHWYGSERRMTSLFGLGLHSFVPHCSLAIKTLDPPVWVENREELSVKPP